MGSPFENSTRERNLVTPTSFQTSASLFHFQGDRVFDILTVKCRPTVARE